MARSEACNSLWRVLYCPATGRSHGGLGCNLAIISNSLENHPPNCLLMFIRNIMRSPARAPALSTTLSQESEQTRGYAVSATEYVLQRNHREAGS